MTSLDLDVSGEESDPTSRKFCLISVVDINMDKSPGEQNSLRKHTFEATFYKEVSIP